MDMAHGSCPSPLRISASLGAHSSLETDPLGQSLCFWQMWVSTAAWWDRVVHRKRFAFAGGQSWVHFQGKHCSGSVFLGMCLGAGSLSVEFGEHSFLAVWLWCSPSPIFSRQAEYPVPSLWPLTCAHWVSLLLALFPLPGWASHSSILYFPPIFSIFYILIIELGPSLHSIWPLILSRNLHKVVEEGGPWHSLTVTSEVWLELSIKEISKPNKLEVFFIQTKLISFSIYS